MTQDLLIDLAAAIADGIPIEWSSLPVENPPVPAAFALRARIVERIAQAHAALPPPDTFSSSLHRSLASLSLPGDDTAPPQTPVTWGPLTIIGKVGCGTFGDVYRAHDRRLNRTVALKLLRRKDRLESAVVDEGQLMARVRHPHVVTVYGAERIEGRVGLWMQFVDGPTLEEELKGRGPLPLSELAEVGIQLAQALTAVHTAGLLHRDVKAQNAMRDSDGRLLLTDFGTGRELSEIHSAGGGELAGTPLYLAPELLDGAPASASSDVYSLGVLLFHLATGSFPVSGRSLRELRQAHRQERRSRIKDVRSDIPKRLAAVIDRAIDPDPARRYSSAAHFESVLIGSNRSVRPALMAATAGVLVVVAVVAALQRREPAPTSSPVADSTPFVVEQHARLTWDPELEIDPAVSPDGRFVAYSAGQPGFMRILVRAVGDGRTEHLTQTSVGDERRPRWSTDGRLLFMADDVLYVTRFSERDGPIAVARVPGIRSAAWDPKNHTILVLAGEDLLRVTPNGGDVQRLRSIEPDAAELAVCADGSRVAYVAGNPEFNTGTTQFANIGPRVVRVSTVEETSSLMLTAQQGLSAAPAWSADCRSLFFLYDADGRRDLRVIEFDGSGIPGSPRRVTSGLDALNLSLSAGEELFVYSSFTRLSNVWSVPIPLEGVATTRDARMVTSGAQTIEEAAVSPDGRWLYFSSNRHGNSDLFRLRLGTREAERLTTDTSDEFINDVSPDGREIAFHAFRNGRREVFVMPSSGGPSTFVAPGLAARWSPDGSQLVIADVVVPERVGTTHRSVSRLDRGWGLPRSLGRQKCTIMQWASEGDGFIGLCGDAVVRRGLDGAVQRTLYALRGDGGPLPLSVFGPRGDTLYLKAFDTSGNVGFWSLPVAGGRPRLIVRLDDPARRSNRGSFWADERALFFILEDRHADLWTARLHSPIR